MKYIIELEDEPNESYFGEGNFYRCKQIPYWSISESMRNRLEPYNEGEWIPVSERLPEKDGRYLVCMSWDYHNMDVIMWADGWNCIRRINGKVDRKSEIDGADIIAWMPLPEPYRQDKEEYELATEQMEHDALYEPTYNQDDGSM